MSYKQKLDDKLRQCDSVLKKILEDVRGLDREKRNKKPNPNKWSIDQIIYHLFSAETMSMRYVSKKTSFPDKLVYAPFQSNKNSFIVNTYLNLPFKVKAPSVVTPTNENIDSEKLDSEWLDLRKDIKRFIENNSADMLQKQVYRHPLGGRMNFLGMLNFFYHHQNRHYKQLKALL